jgi:hypothetical protein
MDRQDTFFRYYRRFLRQFWTNFLDWPRDNVIVAGIAAIAPVFAVYLRDPHQTLDWELIKTTGVVYLVLFCIYAIFQAIRIPWKMDSELTKELQDALEAGATSEARIAELNQKYSNNRPRLGLNIHSVQGEIKWRTTGVPVAFTIQNLGGRIPTSIRFDPIPSKSGKFLLRFDALPHADPGSHPTGINFEVIETGVPQLSAKNWATTQQYQGELLRLFVHDVPVVTSQTEYKLVTHFNDGDDECEHIFHLIFDSHRFCFLENTA